MSRERREELLDVLRRSPGPMSGETLAAALHVSSRSVRTYAAEINARAGTDVVRTSHHGYRLDQAAYRRYRASRRASARKVETPRQRLYFLARHLVTHQEGTHVDTLAELLAVSRETIDGDLARARELLKVHDLRIRRERDVLRIDGTERSKRRLVRQVLLDSADGINPAALRVFEHDYPDMDVKLLRRRTREALKDGGFDVGEFVLNDIVIHLAIAADRVRRGHTVEPGADRADAEGDEGAATGDRLLDVLSDAVHESAGVTLPPGERITLSGIVSSRCGSGSQEVRAEVLALVRDTMGVVSDHFLLDLGDEPAVASLALHVQGLISRARSGRGLRNPLGASFKVMHPLVHELALLFARTIESRAGITVAEGEVDFLSFHLGSLFQRQLDRGPLLTVTVVAPRYLDIHETLAARLGEELAGEALVESVVTTLDHDWASIRSDLVVSTIDLATVTTVPVVLVGPFLSRDDLDRVQDAVRAERARVVRQQLRSNVLSLVDPRLFHALPSVADRDAALHLMCSAMQETGYVDGGFLEDVLDRERRSSTAFGAAFAVPHSLFLDAASTGIGVLVTERPIPWDDRSVRLVLLLAVSPDQRRVFRDVLDRLIGILSGPAAVNALITGSTDYEGFIASLDVLLDA
ncbi:transcription antiterminator [Cellulomonas sp. KRMCY2]|uniref:BglG family transcription antiterminator n=1 Tax=Cellulomonas sp. KRMCY2 TaxID=1304865 RepID=UPI00045EA1BF|nr:PTS sugar transporter subunit IIA [Cellulomonas sp. KRMCY2]